MNRITIVLMRTLHDEKKPSARYSEAFNFTDAVRTNTQNDRICEMPVSIMALRCISIMTKFASMCPGGSLKIVAVSLLAFFQSVSANAQDSWGHLKGRIVYGGEVPEVVSLDIERDAEVCGNHGLTDESLVVNKDDRGIRYVAIWLESKDNVPVHPELQTLPEKPPVLDNKNCRFEPHMQALRTNQLVHFTNSDPVAHNAAVYVRRTTPFSEVIPQNQPLEKKFAKAETLPTRVDCSIHAWMKAWLIITDHPYVAITNENGEFELKNIPSGDWKFRFWHERPGYLPAATRDGKSVELAKGSWTLSIKSGETTDLGELTVDAAVFAKKK